MVKKSNKKDGLKPAFLFTTELTSFELVWQKMWFDLKYMILYNYINNKNNKRIYYK